MYPDEPNQEPIPGTAVHHLASEWVTPFRDLVITHRRELAAGGMEENAATHLAVQLHAFLLDYLHHVLLDPEPQDDQETDVRVVEEDDLPPGLADAVREALRRKMEGNQ